MKRTASAEWHGRLRDGNGTLSSESGTLSQVPYSFKTRFENGDETGTNPEELIGAAHAGCFTMALAAELEKAGLRPERLRTEASVSLEKDAHAWSIKAVHLSVAASVAGATGEQFEQLARKAKETCPVSRVVNATITLDARLASSEESLRKAG